MKTRLMCCRCRKSKRLRSFSQNKKLDGGHYPWCKECVKNYLGEGRDIEERKLYMRDYMRLYMRMLRSGTTIRTGYFRVMVRDHTDGGRWPMQMKMIYSKRTQTLKVTASRRCEDWAQDVLEKIFMPGTIDVRASRAGAHSGRAYRNHVLKTMRMTLPWSRIDESVTELGKLYEVIPLERMGYKRRYRTRGEEE